MSALLDRLRTEEQLARNGGHPVLARSFGLAITEIERQGAEIKRLRSELADEKAIIDAAI